MKFFDNIKEGNSEKFLTLLSIIGLIFTILFMVFTGNGNESYKDILLGVASRVSCNKSAEMFLIFFLSFFGIAASGIYYFLTKWNKTIKPISIEMINTPKIILCTIGIFTFYQNLIVYKYSFVLIMLFIFSIIQYIKEKDKMVNGIVFFFINLYFAYAMNRLLLCLGVNIPLVGGYT